MISFMTKVQSGDGHQLQAVLKIVCHLKWLSFVFTRHTVRLIFFATNIFC